MGNDTSKKNDQFKEDMMQSVILSHNIKGRKKKMELTDQDAYDVIEDLSPNVKYFAVYDGHGAKGREAADGLKKEIRKKLVADKKRLQNSKNSKKLNHISKIYLSLSKKII